ncbi:G-protein coupled receptor family C group 5 member B-like [Brienomyrus brachyistius]|uniref:G-protein coupled receptor family C group 5 member B-like n=1 Tax=Brienomyrus brachyistius TaxID=42636 RepID=UPI0020B1EB61|nr:G-protein coupled receptor family C group 5 member B-like [Brienomyrus brachyistius]XP_048855981.1 G-protein coupled receptor family C group 5 member B-like [Brienomyrus brachyistius]XP_048855982.1 G-protein coupled receptor family C group 5 member B-like [Brienomyrus brachyistius]XP_048855983.1 G-protein coupled receptor family C group 5 member B-like [Brienomyrus brachyistius]XP_048855984.1 G-protein coupled receptor family C group 5 member B-like [Brienomyrus brachyistius]XP_048855985.1 
MAPSINLFTFLVLSLVGGSSSWDEASPCGSGSILTRPYTALCELDAVWGLVVVVVAAAAALASLILLLVVLCRLRKITEAEERSGVAPLLLLLAAIFGLCGLSLGYIAEQQESLCFARRVLRGVLLAICNTCLVFHGLRLRRLGQALVGAACSLWRQQPRWRCRTTWLLITCLASVLLWVAWITFCLYGNAALGLPPTWDNRVQAVVLLAQAWLLILLHAAPEVHATLRPPSRMREANLEEGLSHL